MINSFDRSSKPELKYPQLPPNTEIIEVSLKYPWSISKVSLEY